MNKGIWIFLSAILLAATIPSGAQTITKLESGWKFAFGNASNPGKDWGRGTEYFNYLTKAHSIHNEGPYTETFDDSAWEDITVPHDWVPALPCDSLASHSHGYKTVGWKYPGTSVGWYRKAFTFTKAQEGRHFTIKFDGIFRDASVWFNGIYMGSEPSGYATQTYDITPYIDFDGGPNVLTVRADATFEEGWFYEGAGIYRNAYLIETKGPYIPDGSFWASWDGSKVTIHSEVKEATHRILDADDNEMTEPRLWTPEGPYLYTLESTVGEDVYRTKIGLRTVEFNAEEGFLLNGKKFILKGVNLHQDHAGVGAAMPDELIEWRVKQLKKLGVNAIRCSHNPASPALLDICDREGILLIDENRLMGVNAHHRRLLENMVMEGRSHPSVILWSVGNEEWGLENDVRGIKIVKEMQECVQSLDPTRQTTAANAGGGTLIEGLEVHGYNYIVQNDVDGRHARHPEWIIFGSEETTGCGTRGIYEAQEGRMTAINRTGEPENVIERGWKYYAEHPWTGGVFFWTGFDYRGEPNPLKYPATLSEFGILDYCGFPKDEAFYLKSWWTDEPTVHICGPTADIWVYSNCDEVRLSVNGKNLGKKKMPRNGHLVWKNACHGGKIKATGYIKGRKAAEDIIEPTGPAANVEVTSERIGRLQVFELTAKDAKGRYVPDGAIPVKVSLDGPGRIIGYGNGDPAGSEKEQSPDGKTCALTTFSGKAQVLVLGDGVLVCRVCN